MADVEKRAWQAVTTALEAKNYTAALDAALQIGGAVQQNLAGSREAMLSVFDAQDLGELRPKLVPEQFKSVSKDGISTFFRDPRLQLLRVLQRIAKRDDCGDAEAAEIIDTHAKSLFQD